MIEQDNETSFVEVLGSVTQQTKGSGPNSFDPDGSAGSAKLYSTVV